LITYVFRIFFISKREKIAFSELLVVDEIKTIKDAENGNYIRNKIVLLPQN
jgi:hypothetical protein